MEKDRKSNWLKRGPLLISVLGITLLTGPIATLASTSDSGKLIHNSKDIQVFSENNTSFYYPQPDKDPYKDPAQLLIVQTKRAPIAPTDMIVLNTAGTNALKIKDGVIYIDSDGTGLKPISEEIYAAMGFTKDMLEGTQFQQDIQWNRIYNRLQPKSIPNQWSVTETHGVNKAKTNEFAYSVGAEVGANLNDITGKITSNISKKFSTTTTVTDQISHTVTDLFPAKPKEYPYPDYRVAVYQKQEVYTVIPGEKLKNAMTNLAKVLGTSVENVSTTSFTYLTDELRPIVTPDH